MNDSIPPPALEEVCEQALRLPCSPTLLPRLARALQSDSSSAVEIEQLISLDSSLAAATLRLANSAAFGRGGIDTIEGAIFVLGAKEIYRLAALVLVNRWETSSQRKLRWEPGDFSRHALCTAIAAEVLAGATERVDPQVAYTAGLVVDLGKLALAHACGDFYTAIRACCAATGGTWEQAERTVLGYHHGDATVRLLAVWKFPENIVGCAQFLFKPTEAPATVLPLVTHLLAAKYVATTLGPGVTEEGFLGTVHGALLHEWGFTTELLEEAMPVVIERAGARLGERLTHGVVAI